MPKRMDCILLILSILGYWAIILGTLEVQVRLTPKEAVRKSHASTILLARALRAMCSKLL